MNRKILSIFGIVLLMLAFQSCSSNPEKTILTRYFNALSLKDLTTLSTMAIEPASFEVNSWEIISVSEEVVEPFKLAELDAKEQELKKMVEDSVGITLEARDMLDEAIFEQTNARTSAARRAAKLKVDEMQTAYDEQRAKHDQMQKDYNLARETASKEEDIATFSLGGEYPAIREFTGEVSSKSVDVQIVNNAGTSQYTFNLRRYMLNDEAANMTHRGRYIIVNIKKIT